MYRKFLGRCVRNELGISHDKTKNKIRGYSLFSIIFSIVNKKIKRVNVNGWFKDVFKVLKRDLSFISFKISKFLRYYYIRLYFPVIMNIIVR